MGVPFPTAGPSYSSSRRWSRGQYEPDPSVSHGMAADESSSTSWRQHRLLPKVSGLPQNAAEGLSKGGLIGRRESSKLFEHKSWINGGEDWFEDGGFE